MAQVVTTLVVWTGSGEMATEPQGEGTGVELDWRTTAWNTWFPLIFWDGASV